MRLLLLVLLAACAAHPAPPAAVPEPAEAEAMLPPMFDAATLRAGFLPGTVIRYRMEDAGETHIEEWNITSSDADGVTIHNRTFSADGATLTGESDFTGTWTELARHGTFPAALTTATDSTVDVPAGHFETRYFEVRAAEPGQPTSKFHFAPTLVGPPVWAEFSVDGQVVGKMELLSRTGP